MHNNVFWVAVADDDDDDGDVDYNNYVVEVPLWLFYLLRIQEINIATEWQHALENGCMQYNNNKFVYTKFITKCQNGM